MARINASCPHCGEKFSLIPSMIGKVAECSACGESFTVKRDLPKKKNTGKIIFFAIFILLGVSLPFLLAGKDELKEAIVENQNEIFAEPGFLLNVENNSIYEDSPFEVEDQWTYKPIAKTYPNIAGMYPLLAANANLEGEKLHYKAEFDSVSGWDKMAYKAVWNLAPALYSGEYDVYLRYGAVIDQVDNGVRLKIAGQTVSALIQNTGAENRFARQKMGTVKLKKGESYQAVVEATYIEEDTEACSINAFEIVPSKSPFRWFDTAQNKWSESIPRSLRLSSKTTDQRPPVQFIKGKKKGFVIMTTLAFKKNSDYLRDFVKHKESLGYKFKLLLI